MTSIRDQRREQNQYIFRRANEQLLEIIDGRVPEGQPVPFLCECADEKCLERVEVKPMMWEAVAERPKQFLIVAGHARIDGEIVVDTLGGFEVVEKPE
jgi:hypothetical protein